MGNKLIVEGNKIKIEVEDISPCLSFVGTIEKIEEDYIVVTIQGHYAQKEDRRVKCSILKESKICTFKTVIKGSITNQIILEMPEEKAIQVIQRRKYARVPVDFPVGCFLVGYEEKKINSNKKFPATVKDISGGGVLLESPLSLPIGTVLVFELEIEQQVFILTVKVLRNIEDKANENNKLGCEFLAITDGDRQKIIAFTNKEQLKLRRRTVKYR